MHVTWSGLVGELSIIEVRYFRGELNSQCSFDWVKVSSKLAQDRRARSVCVRDVVSSIGDAGSTRPGECRHKYMYKVALTYFGFMLRRFVRMFIFHWPSSTKCVFRPLEKTSLKCYEQTGLLLIVYRGIIFTV